MHYIIQQFRSPRGCLSYIVSNVVSKEALIIDPSEEVALNTYLDYLTLEKLRLLYIVDTHTHADHISSSKAVREATHAQIVMHQLSPSSRVDLRVNHGDILELGSHKVKVLATPGHTDESITLQAGNALFTGDTLLIGATGRTDFQKGSSEDLYSSLWRTIIPKGKEMLVYPAHDYKGRSHTTIENEERTNPRLQLSEKEFVRFLNEHKPPKPELFDKAISANSF